MNQQEAASTTPPRISSPPEPAEQFDELGELFRLLENPDALLTERQLSLWLGFAPRTLSNMRYLGKGPRFLRLSSKHGVRYRVKTVSLWLKRRERGSTADRGGK